MKNPLRAIIRKMVEKVSGGRLYGPRSLPLGCDLCYDLHRLGYAPFLKSVFDVGANRGQFSRQIRAAFPKARLYAFEPIPQSFRILRESASGDPLFSAHNFALGSRQDCQTVHLQPKSEFNSLVVPLNQPSPTGQTETVQIRRLDSVIDELGIVRLDFLKTDTEGYDLEVLRGADQALTAHRIFLVFSEVGFNPNDPRHTSFTSLFEFLQQFNFELVGFYDQASWRQFGALEYANALFINTTLAARLLPHHPI